MKSITEIKEAYGKIQEEINKLLPTQKISVDHPLRQEQGNMLREEMKNIISYWDENGGIDGHCFKIDKNIYDESDLSHPTYVKYLRAKCDDNQRYIVCEKETFDVGKQGNLPPNFRISHSITSILALYAHPDFLITEEEYNDAKDRTLKAMAECSLEYKR